MLLRHLQILGKAVALLNSPGRAAQHDLAHLAGAQLAHSSTTNTRRQILKEDIRELINLSAHLLVQQISRQQAHAAVDIKPDTARRDHSMLSIGRRDSSDGKAIAPVNV